MFSRKLKPIFVDNKYLVRLGPQRDGGYVIEEVIYGFKDQTKLYTKEDVKQTISVMLESYV